MMIIRQDCNLDPEDLPVQLNVEGYTNEEIIQKIPKELRHMISELWLDGKIGVCAGSIQIVGLNNFKKDETDNNVYADGFTLSLPFAGHSLIWEIIFSHKDLMFAPDINFEDESFLMTPQLLKLIKANASSLGKWNCNNPKSLINLIKEYLILYKKYHINMLTENEKYSRLNFEYSSLVGETGVSTDEIEVLIEPNDVVHFLINISVDISSLPPYIAELYIENPGVDSAILLVTFHRLDGSKTQPQLRLSPDLEKVLGGSGSKFIPSFPPQGCLMDYVPEVRKMLVDKIEGIASNHKMKMEYITQMLAKYGLSVIEYDFVTYSKITLLFEIKHFYWLVIISLSNKFPYEKPKLILRSIYHMSNNKPYTENSPDYPYSPRWLPDQMVQRSMEYIFENITTFQNSSIMKNHI